MADVLDILHSQLLVADGAMGTQLQAKGAAPSECLERLNLTRPELVQEVHREYLVAGAQLIETNSYAANRNRLRRFGLEAQVYQLNFAAARLARQVAGSQVLVAGAIGPLGPLNRPLRDEQIKRLFAEQAAALADGGVDLLMLETFSDLAHLKLALAAAKAATSLPVVCQMAFISEGRTADGAEATRFALELSALGADVLGANCGGGPHRALQAVRRIARATSRPVSALPNAGYPQWVEGQNVYLSNPRYFAERAVELIEAGATLIGGCCGTTPEHIRLLKERVQSLRPAVRTVHPLPVPKIELTPAPEPDLGFLSRSRPLITVELLLPRGLSYAKTVQTARELMLAGADAVNLADNSLAQVRLSNLAVAKILKDEVGVETIVHVSGRDRNLLGLQSHLMGIAALGLRHVLAITGDPAPADGAAGSVSVYEATSFKILEVIGQLNAGLNLAGDSITRPAGLIPGGALNANAFRLPAEIKRLARKVELGARFAQTQPLFDLGRIPQLYQLTRPLGIPVLLGVLPLVSYRNAEYLHNEVPGMHIPEAVRERLRRAGSKEAATKEGLAIAKEVIDAAWGAPGFYLIPPFGKGELALELVEYIRSKPPG